mgnify:FL=1
MSRLESKLKNFGDALQRLKEAIAEYRRSGGSGDVIRDGMIQRFEFTYELAWKTAKDYLEDMGIVDKSSPKAVIREAYSQRLITNENRWLLMINDRNLSSHVYKKEMAEEIAERIANDYVYEFEGLLKNIKRGSDI